jgi:hypothetical protein
MRSLFSFSATAIPHPFHVSAAYNAFFPQLALTVCGLFMTSGLALPHQPDTSPNSKELSHDSWQSTPTQGNISVSGYKVEQCRAEDPRSKVKTGRVLIANSEGKFTGAYIASALYNFGMPSSLSALFSP